MGSYRCGTLCALARQVVNELDRCSKNAQDMLLTYLGHHQMKPGHAFLGTTDRDVVATRLSDVKQIRGFRYSLSSCTLVSHINMRGN
jgi:hypothetical protein